VLQQQNPHSSLTVFCEKAKDLAGRFSVVRKGRPGFLGMLKREAKTWIFSEARERFLLGLFARRHNITVNDRVFSTFFITTTRMRRQLLVLCYYLLLARLFRAAAAARESFTVTVTMEIEQVFALLTDYENFSTHFSAIIRSELVREGFESRHGVGAARRLQALGIRSTHELRIQSR